MSFTTYNEFKEAISSEKISLVFLYPRQKVTTFVSQGSNIWKKTVSNIVTKLFSGSTELTVQTSSAVDASNPWFYDVTTNELWYYTVSTLPDDDNLIGEFQLQYANAPINLSYDLGDTSEEVEYESRVLKTVGFKSQIGSDQKSISITGSGTLSLQNNDGHFDSMFDSFIWENKLVEIYSYNRDLAPSSAKLQYKGFIVNKSFNSDNVNFKIQDAIFKLDTLIPMNLFTSSDGVNSSFVGNSKRNIYGKLSGLLCRSVDQVGTGYDLTGTISGTSASFNITGVGTSFLTELAQNDNIIIGSKQYIIDLVTSNTALTISNTGGISSSFIGSSASYIPSIPSPEVNRTFFVADHVIKQGSSTITSMTQLNRLTVADIDGYEVADIIVISGDSHVISEISGNQIKLTFNALQFYPNGTIVLKSPITEVFVNENKTDLDDLLSISNVTDCRFTLSNKTEFNITNNNFINELKFDFTNGSDLITYNGSSQLSNIFRERDWIKQEGDGDNSYIRIVYISGNIIKLQTPYGGVTGTFKKAFKRRPDYVTDSSSVSINCSGKTKDGLSTGVLIRTGADVVEELLKDIGLTSDIDSTSFTKASEDNNIRISLALPYNITDSPPKVKDIINDMNETVFGSLALKQDLTLSYTIQTPERDDNILEISDDDVISWKFIGKETNSYQKVIGRYKFQDYVLSSKEKGNSYLEFISNNVLNFDISNKRIERKFRVFDENDAQELSERFIFNNEQTIMELYIKSDLRLTSFEIGNKVKVNFARFMNQPSIGDSQRVFRVVGIKKDYNNIELKLSDLGNLFNRSAVISNDTVIDYSTSTSNEKRVSGFITDDNGIITGIEDTNGTNLIS